ncbi:MAG: helix-turn-helix domain-containing protein [Corallococcus sp.]|nr:helix-turn-helix domain-containing protein [Corallococcus sp.]
MKKEFNNIDIVITGNVAWQDNLSWDVKILYGVIRGLTRNDFYCCYASNDYLAETMGKKARTIRSFLNELEDLGFIQRDYAYIDCDDGKIRRKRAIVPSDLYSRFEEKRAEMREAYEASKIIPAKGGKKLPPEGGKNLPPNNKCLPNIKSKEDITPKPPYKGGRQKATLTEPERFETLGEFQNVRLTESQKAALKGEFGPDMLSALIEQLDAYIQSDERRARRFAKKKTEEFYATLRDWALRRKEPEPTAKVLVGGRDMERRPYTDDEINALFTPLDDDCDDSQSDSA